MTGSARPACIGLGVVADAAADARRHPIGCLHRSASARGKWDNGCRTDELGGDRRGRYRSGDPSSEAALGRSRGSHEHGAAGRRPGRRTGRCALGPGGHHPHQSLHRTRAGAGHHAAGADQGDRGTEGPRRTPSRQEPGRHADGARHGRDHPRRGHHRPLSAEDLLARRRGAPGRRHRHRRHLEGGAAGAARRARRPLPDPVGLALGRRRRRRPLRARQAAEGRLAEAVRDPVLHRQDRPRRPRLPRLDPRRRHAQLGDDHHVARRRARQHLRRGQGPCAGARDRRGPRAGAGCLPRLRRHPHPFDDAQDPVGRPRGHPHVGGHQHLADDVARQGQPAARALSTRPRSCTPSAGSRRCASPAAATA